LYRRLSGFQLGANVSQGGKAGRTSVNPISPLTRMKPKVGASPMAPPIQTKPAISISGQNSNKVMAGMAKLVLSPASAYLLKQTIAAPRVKFNGALRGVV
jgi:hypothetical protein